MLIHDDVNSKYHPFPNLTPCSSFINPPAEFLKNSFMRQCNTYCTKEQYDRSHVIMSDWLCHQNTVFVLGEALIEELKKYQAHLMTKERYLAHYIRHCITMCADAMTTSPVESMNDLTKNTFGIGANMNLSTSVVALVEDHDARYDRHVNSMLLKMDSTNLSSKSHTKNHIHHKCQRMIDLFRDKALAQKCVQVNEHEWICWNFIDPDVITPLYPSKEATVFDDGVGIDEEVECVYEKTLLKSMQIPHFLNVYRLTTCTFDGTLFLRCSCRHFDRYVQLVPCVLRLCHHVIGSILPCTPILMQVRISLYTCFLSYQLLSQAQHDQHTVLAHVSSLL